MASYPRPVLSGRNGVFSQKAMDELGIIYTDAPASHQCPYCGNILYPRCFVVGDKPIRWFEEPETCGCDRGLADHAQREEQRCFEQAQVEQEAQAARTQARIDAILGKSGMGRRFLDRTFETFLQTPENKAAYEAAVKYAAQFKTAKESGVGLYFEGSKGTGKTHLAAAIALAVARQGTPVLFRTGVNLFSDVRAAIQTGEEAKTLELYKTVPLLVIDDLGKEKASEWTSATLFDIINTRYENLMPLVLTTNFNTSDLAGRLTPPDGMRINAEAIISRLQECCTCLSMVWADFRCRGST